jgi:hypothetical protein
MPTRKELPNSIPNSKESPISKTTFNKAMLQSSIQVTRRIESKDIIIENRKECKHFIVSRICSGNTTSIRQIRVKHQICLTIHLHFKLLAKLCDLFLSMLTIMKHIKTKLKYYKIKTTANLPVE